MFNSTVKRRGNIVRTTIFFVLLLGLTAVPFQKTHAQGVMDDFEPGTTCRKSSDPRLAVICGVVRRATPDPVETDYGRATNPNAPAEGVSVYVYECDKNSPTCKENGALTNPFSSTSTDENGYYWTTMRKIGNLQIRYLAFSCNNTLAGLYKIPSMASFTFNVPLKCPASSQYSRIPLTLNPVSQSGTLSCDVRPQLSDNVTPSTFPLSYQARFSTPYQSKAQFNFDLSITGADSRYKKRGTVLTTPLNLDQIYNPASVTPTKGAFYHEDCKMVYLQTGLFYPQYLCYQAVNRPGAAGESLDAYETVLYNDRYFAIENFLSNIPAKNTLLFYKDLTVRQDVTSYVQNPTAPAQLLHTIFSNCQGSVQLRKKGNTSTDVYPDCEELKACNSAGSSEDGVYRNRQYSGGPARNLANPAILQRESRTQVGDTNISSIKICQHNGNQITIGQIQPPWSYCQLGMAGCDYVLDKTYWNPEFGYFFGEKGASTKVGYGFEGANDTYYADTPNSVPFLPAQEKAGVPVKGGTYFSDSNYSPSRNNGLASTMGGILSDEYGTTGNYLSYVLERPGESVQDKAIYQEGVVKIEDAGSNLMQYCENSNVNEEHTDDLPFTRNNENAIDMNQNFRGNIDHYFTGMGTIAAILGITGNNGKITPTSTIYVTSAARTREDAMLGANRLITGWSADTLNSLDAYDSILTSSQGNGRYNVLDIFLGAIVNLFGGNNNETKSFYDRMSTFPLTGGDLRDDLKVDFPLSEENFEAVFPLPNFGSGNMLVSGWNGSSLGAPECYPWQAIPANTKCYESDTFGLDRTAVPTEIKRTCRVNICDIVTRSRTRTCQIIGTDLDNNLGAINTSTISCSEIDNLPASDSRRSFTPAMQNCAIDKLDCYDGEWDMSCLDLEEVDTPPDCPDITDMGEYYPGPGHGEFRNGIWGTFGDCPNGDEWERYQSNPSLNRSCEVTIERSKSARGCDMEEAGPYQCAGNLTKDSTFRTNQQVLRTGDNGSEDVQLDRTKTINNEMWKKLSHPNPNKVYSTLAFISAKTSVTNGDAPNGPAGQLTNDARNKNKDVASFGGISPEYKMISAHPLYANYYEDGNPIEYGCYSPDLQNTNPQWQCPLMSVPSPEVIDPSTLSINEACSLSTEPDCDASFGAGPLSPTFRTILNAAASRFNVHATSIATYLASIHNPYAYLYSTGMEPTLQEASFPWYGKVGGCDDSDTSAIGPYDWIGVWFNSQIASGVGAALNEISDGRGNTASRCNFLDATYAIAASIASTGGGCGADYTTASNGILLTMFGADRTGIYNNPNLVNSAVWYSCR